MVNYQKMKKETRNELCKFDSDTAEEVLNVASNKAENYLTPDGTVVKNICKCKKKFLDIFKANCPM